jgi:hypothetical protein
MTRLGVVDVARQTMVQSLLAQAGIALPVDSMPSWYS